MLAFATQWLVLKGFAGGEAFFFSVNFMVQILLTTELQSAMILPSKDVPVAQWIERFPAEEEVGGSTPLGYAPFKLAFRPVFFSSNSAAFSSLLLLLKVPNPFIHMVQLDSVL
jgi:hypothetical protein